MSVCPRCEERPVHRTRSGYTESACSECRNEANALRLFWQDKGMPLSGNAHKQFLKAIPAESAQ